MKFFGFLLAAVLSAGCAGTFDAPPKAPTRTETPAEPEPVRAPLQVLDRDGWSATVPSSWVVAQVPSEDGDSKLEVMMRSPHKLGRGPIIFSVNSIKLDADQKPEDFGGGVALAMLSVGRVKIVAAEPRDISGKPGSAMVYLTPSGIVIVQYAAGVGGRGYIARCGGDVTEVETVAKICGPVLDSFKLK